jgi:hypothetical protein
MSENPKENQGNGSDIATGRCPWLGQRRSVYTRGPVTHQPFSDHVSGSADCFLLIWLPIGP